MSSNLRDRAPALLCVFLALTVTVLALHQSVRRPSALRSTEPGTNATANATESGPALRPAPALAASLPRYSGIASASERRRWLVDQLRAMGVPNDVLALVALEDFEVEWDRRFEGSRGDQARMERVQLEKDMTKDAAMRAALGAEGFKQWDTKNMLWEAMSTPVDVKPGEAESIYALKKRLQQRQLELADAEINGQMDRAQVIAAVQKSYADYNQELKAVLGDERYAKSQQLDDDFTAGNLRYELAKVNTTESQFQELFKADKQWNQSLAQLSPGSPDYAETFAAINEAHDQEYERILGADSFHNLREQEDTGVIQMKKYADLWGLDATKIDNVYDTMNGYRKAVGDYQLQVQALQRQGQSVDWAAVNNTLQQLAAQTQQTLQSSVGADSLSRLQRNGVLRWAGPGFRPTYGGGSP